MHKILFVIVEGKSDETALGIPLQNIFEENMLHVEIVHGDITSDSKNNAGNIVNEVCALIQHYAQQNHFTNADFAGVIHITDLDGTYISNQKIIQDKTLISAKYSKTRILHPNPSEIVKRNQIKCANIERLLQLNKIWGCIPYRIYYMSCDLDNALYGKYNSSDNEKEKNSYSFAEACKNDPQKFLRLAMQLLPPDCTDYKLSWDFVKKDENSLKRYSNLALSFPEKVTVNMKH